MLENGTSFSKIIIWCDKEQKQASFLLLTFSDLVFKLMRSLSFIFRIPTIKSKNFIRTNNFGQNIWRLFHVLTQFHFTESETKQDFSHQRVKVWVAEWRKTEECKKFEGKPINSWMKRQVCSYPPYMKVFTVVLEFWKKSPLIHFTEKPNFENLSTILCPKMSE